MGGMFSDISSLLNSVSEISFINVRELKKLHNPSTVFLFSLYSTISILQAGFPCTAMGTGYYADTGADCTGYFMCTKESTQGLRYKETDCSQILQLDGVNL